MPSKLWYVVIPTPFGSGIVSGSATINVPGEFRNKPQKWVRIRNFWNWRDGTAYAVTSPYALLRWYIDIEGITRSISDLSGANPVVQYTTAVMSNALSTYRTEDPVWKPISPSSSLLPMTVSIGWGQLPLGPSIVFDTTSLLEIELSDDLICPGNTSDACAE